jgi:ERCC4-type nuclease
MTLTLWVAPTEHDLRRTLPAYAVDWQISSLPERHGCDVLIPTQRGIVGFQRKTLPDLVASLQDGRLYYELNQLRCSATVTHSFLCVEGRFDRSTDDANYTEANISVNTLRALIAKFQWHGTGFLPTCSLRDTISAMLSVARYISSGKGDDLHRPKQVTNEWGQVTSESYGVFLLQSFPGIGPKVATAIYRHFGTVPLAWTVSAADLAQVPGVGKVRAQRLLDALSGPAAGPGPPGAAP